MTNINNILDQLKDHEQRILSLEEKFSRNPRQEKKGTEKRNYTGPAGGIRLLTMNDFFANKKDLTSVRNELQKKGYNYPTKSIDNALRRASSVKGGLVALREEGKKVYVERK